MDAVSLIKSVAQDPAELIRNAYRTHNHVFFPENHLDSEKHNLVINVLKFLGGSDRLSLGLELDISHQEAINEYLRTGDEKCLKPIEEFETQHKMGAKRWRETSYTDILRIAHKLGIPVSPLDYADMDEVNENMAKVVLEKSPSVVYIGGAHVPKVAGLSRSKDRTAYAFDMELEDAVRMEGSHTGGFTAIINQSELKSKPMGFDLKNPDLVRFLDELYRDTPFSGWYKGFDGFLYIPKGYRLPSPK